MLMENSHVGWVECNETQSVVFIKTGFRDALPSLPLGPQAGAWEPGNSETNELRALRAFVVRCF